MNSNIYGGITYPGTSLVFDKIYDSYKQATTNIEEQNSGPQYDNVMNGRYVLIKYCERAFSYEEKKQMENPIIEINSDNNCIDIKYTIILPGTYTFSFSFLSQIGGYSVYVNQQSIDGDSANGMSIYKELQGLKKGDFIYINISGDNSIPNCLEIIKNSFRFECSAISSDINLDNFEDYSFEEQYYYNYKQDGGYSFDRTILRKVYKDNTYQYEEIGKIESAIPLADLAAQVADAVNKTKALTDQLDYYDDNVKNSVDTAVSIIGESNQINSKGYPITAWGYDTSKNKYYYEIYIKDSDKSDALFQEIKKVIDKGNPYHISAYLRFEKTDKKEDDYPGQRYDNFEILGCNYSNGGQGGWIYVSYNGYNEELPLRTIIPEEYSAEDLETYSQLFIIEKCEEGDYSTSKGAFATGIDNKALGTGSFSAGRENEVIGAYAASMGRNNKVAYAGSAFGRNNTINGQLGTSFGQHNTIDGHDSATFGLYNEIKNSAAEAMVGGIHNIASGKGQFVIGTANEDNSDALFIVGNGKATEDIRGEETETNKLNRSNAFEVRSDGSVIIGSSIKYANGMPIAGDLTTGIKKTPNETAMYANLWQGSDKIPEDYTLKALQEDGKIIYLITNGNDLYKFFSDIIINKTITGTIYARQTQNIYLNDIFKSQWYENTTLNQWISVIHNNTINVSSFEYDGQGFGIHGLYQKNPNRGVDANGEPIYSDCGLLPKISKLNGNINFKNIHLCNVYFCTADKATAVHQGGFIGDIARNTSDYTVTFINCGIDENSTIMSSNKINSSSGFIGYVQNNQNSISWNNCYSKASISNSTGSFKGSFVGNSWTQSDQTANYYFTNCYASGEYFVVLRGNGNNQVTLNNVYCKALNVDNDGRLNLTATSEKPRYVSNFSLSSMPKLASTFKELYGEVLPQEQSFYGLDTINFDKLFNNISFYEGTKYFDINNVSNITFSNPNGGGPITKLGIGEDYSLQMKIYSDRDLTKNPDINTFLTTKEHSCAANLKYNIQVVDKLPTDSPKNTLVFIKSTATTSETTTN